VKADNKVTREEMAQKIGVSKKTIEREIKKITQLSYVGRGYSGHWEINMNDER
jgi:ATP-dependent DNA helicase RecG